MTHTDQLCINTLRFISIDAVEKANSGHPGLPLGAAPMAYVLWAYFLKHNPNNPKWIDRDRFILSAGHGSALLYALLHCFGYNVSIDDIKAFRQYQSKTPGHPEYGHTPGVEATTGPLGQGFAMGVGMAISEAFLSAQLNCVTHSIIDHYTYAIVSDGDLMEGISSEAASLAGTLKLGKLIYLYDDNSISIEGSTDLAFTESVSGRFKAFDWQVIEVNDGNDVNTIKNAIKEAQSDTERPSLIKIKTHIGFGSPKQDSADSHGAPLGPAALQETRKTLNWPHAPFEIPEEAQDHFQSLTQACEHNESEWHDRLKKAKDSSPERAKRIESFLNNRTNTTLKSMLTFNVEEGPLATRAASGKVLNDIVKHLPNLMGGSADLAPSNNTYLKEKGEFHQTKLGQNLRFGVREHAMGAIINGMTLHGGTIAYAATFLIFSDYMKPAIRLAALMNIPSIFVFTHDSVGLGEDGPTHQPIEHLLTLRSIPNLTVLRPADSNETAIAWEIALQSTNPSALILTRQKLPILPAQSVIDAKKGAYVLKEASRQTPDICIIATGSEVTLGLEVQKRLEEKGISTRLVSMMSWELFDAQPTQYKQDVLLENCIKISIEAGSAIGWERYTGSTGKAIGINTFGLSAPGSEAMAHFGFDADTITSDIAALVSLSMSTK